MATPRQTLRWPPLVEAQIMTGLLPLKSPIAPSPSASGALFDDFDDGSSPFAGVCETYTGMISTGDEYFQAYVKVLESKSLVNELLAGSVGRALNLPIPDFFLVRAESQNFPESQFLANTVHDKIIVFASRATKSSPLERRAAGNESATWERLAAMNGAQEAVMFDEWMANEDRHANNILLSPNQFWLIDHEQCFTGRDWVPSNLIADKAFSNLLADALLAVMNLGEKQNLVTTAHKAEPQCQKIGKMAASSDLLKQSKKHKRLSAPEFKALCDFLQQRVSHIESLVGHRVNPHSLF